MISKNIRKQFIDFFEDKGHFFAQPAPVLPQNDPTLLFNNAGMNQFKDVFLGVGQRDYSRAVNSQICIRVSGKHNDLEEVGLDKTHLTSFEMLGNWSFGDYYKKEAITWAWELFTQVYKIPKAKLYATVYETDNESFSLWEKETDINQKHILRCGKKDNFWEMGDIGPCGPCSEIHIDMGSETCNKNGVSEHICRVNGDCNRYVELWNLVFIQYNRKDDGSLEDLPDKHVDTGAGFERLVAYLENKTSVYDTDLFYPVIKRIEVLTGIPYKDAEDGMPHRVLADHIRTVTFAIADNVLPSNEGRGYVLRRLIRRALRYAQKLGMHEPVLYKLVKTVISIMSDYLEYLPERQEFIENLVKAEEESFLRTLDAGLIIFEQIVSNIKQQNNDEISGKEAFKLYDTYGFPLDLTEVMAREQFLTVDVEGFNSQLEKQKERSRQGRKKEEYTGARAPAGGEARLVSNENDRLGMARHHTATHLLHSALREVLGKHVSQSGSLVDIDRLRFDFLHYRALTKENLREVGDLINRKISDHLKVDIFPMSLKEAKEMGALSFFGEKYDEIVNVVKTGSFSMELCGGTHVNNTADIEKIKIISETAIAAGTRRIEAVCGKENIEKYEQKKKTELIIKIKGRLKHIESGIQQIKEYEPYIYEVDYSALEDRALADLEELENRSLQDGKLLDKRLAKIKNKQAGKYMKDLLNEIRSVNNRGFGIFCKMMDNYDMPMLRTLSDNIVQARDNVVIILAASKGDKGLFLVRIPGNKINLNAVDIINELTSLAGGGGGGRPDMAQAGGANPDKIPGALSKVEEFIIENS